jgi:hypothetical protein
MRLGGWHRLWIVVSLVWLLCVWHAASPVFKAAWPTADQVRSSSIDPGHQINPLDRLSWDESSQKFVSNPRYVPPKLTPQQYAELHRRRQIFAVDLTKMVATFGLVPIFLIYLLGRVAHWVIRGFRKSA